MSSKKQMGIGAIMSYASIAINIVVGLLYTPWIIGQIGDSDYGLYTLANSLISLFIVDFGLSTATSRYVSKYRSEGSQEKVNNFLGAIYKLFLIIDLIIFIALFVAFFLIDVIYVKLTPEEIERFKIVYIISASFAVINFPFLNLSGIINAYEKFIQLKFADLLYRFLLVTITIVTLILGGGLYALVTIHAAVGIVIIIYKLIVIKTTTPVKTNFRYSDKGLYKEIFKFSAWMTVITMSQRLIIGITPNILGVVAASASTAIAVFGVVSQIEGYSYVITTAIKGMFLPKITQIYSKNEHSKEINKLLISVGKYQAALNGLIIVGFALLGQPFIRMWLGETYLAAYYGLLLVLVPGFFYNSMQVAHTAVIVKNKIKWQALAEIVSGIVNIALSFVMSYLWGVIGACVSILIAYIVRITILIIIYKKVMKLEMGHFVLKCQLRMLIPVALCLLIGFPICNAIEVDSWILFVAIAIVISVVYLLLAFLVGFDRQQRKGMATFLKNKLRKIKNK
ncbi:MAG: oligosaccharide flippase family protein [Clostridia bacterium]|nr:oligosaccharide flippase family protein [Clostridia bacterium]